MSRLKDAIRALFRRDDATRVLLVGGRVIHPVPGKGVMMKTKDISAEELASFGLILNPEPKQEE